MSTLTSEDVGTGTRTSADDGSGFDRGWFCVRTAPFPCPAEGCPFVASYMTAAHLIVVWPAIDDRALLTHARNARELGRNPEVVEYQPDFGKAIAFDAWRQAGFPVHGTQDAPDVWPPGGRL